MDITGAEPVRLSGAKPFDRQIASGPQLSGEEVSA